ncbi:MAG: hypothetical protein LQ350_004079 [Teloschistes chrysophthalmus]|nr:MAG: hypothetical protein LQ350_004079 [Niorma chrysophthalma]
MHPSKEIIQSWPKPNFINPETRGPALTVVNIVFIILVVLVVALRFYTRLRITRSFGLDDWVIGASLVPTFALTVVVLVADNHYGWNRHSWDLHAHNGPHGYKLCLAAQVLFFWAATLNKISLLCFYKRLTTGGIYKLWYKWCIVGGIAFQVLMLIAFFIVAVNACKPLSAFWTPLATYPHECIDEGNYMLSFGIITIFLDFAILLLPIPLVMGLQLSRKQRIAVITLFGLGFIVCIAGIVQVYYIDVALRKSYDETWDGWPLWVASAVEVDLGILCVSIPAIRPFLAIYVPRLLESTGIHGKGSKESSENSGSNKNPFRYAAKHANAPWAKDLEGGYKGRKGSAEKKSAGSSEGESSIGVLEKEISQSEEREFNVDRHSRMA